METPLLEDEQDPKIPERDDAPEEALAYWRKSLDRAPVVELPEPRLPEAPDPFAKEPGFSGMKMTENLFMKQPEEMVKGFAAMIGAAWKYFSGEVDPDAEQLIVLKRARPETRIVGRVLLSPITLIDVVTQAGISWGKDAWDRWAHFEPSKLEEKPLDYLLDLTFIAGVVGNALRRTAMSVAQQAGKRGLTTTAAAAKRTAQAGRALEIISEAPFVYGTKLAALPFRAAYRMVEAIPQLRPIAKAILTLRNSFATSARAKGAKTAFLRNVIEGPNDALAAHWDQLLIGLAKKHDIPKEAITNALVGIARVESLPGPVANAVRAVKRDLAEREIFLRRIGVPQSQLENARYGWIERKILDKHGLGDLRLTDLNPTQRARIRDVAKRFVDRWTTDPSWLPMKHVVERDFTDTIEAIASGNWAHARRKIGELEKRTGVPGFVTDPELLVPYAFVATERLKGMLRFVDEIARSPSSLQVTPQMAAGYAVSWIEKGDWKFLHFATFKDASTFAKKVRGEMSRAAGDAPRGWSYFTPDIIRESYTKVLDATDDVRRTLMSKEHLTKFGVEDTRALRDRLVAKNLAAPPKLDAPIYLIPNDVASMIRMLLPEPASTGFLGVAHAISNRIRNVFYASWLFLVIRWHVNNAITGAFNMLMGNLNPFKGMKWVRDNPSLIPNAIKNTPVVSAEVARIGRLELPHKVGSPGWVLRASSDLNMFVDKAFRQRAVISETLRLAEVENFRRAMSRGIAAAKDAFTLDRIFKETKHVRIVRDRIVILGREIGEMNANLVKLRSTVEATERALVKNYAVLPGARTKALQAAQEKLGLMQRAAFGEAFDAVSRIYKSFRKPTTAPLTTREGDWMRAVIQASMKRQPIPAVAGFIPKRRAQVFAQIVEDALGPVRKRLDDFGADLDRISGTLPEGAPVLEIRQQLAKLQQLHRELVNIEDRVRVALVKHQRAQASVLKVETKMKESEAIFERAMDNAAIYLYDAGTFHPIVRMVSNHILYFLPWMLTMTRLLYSAPFRRPVQFFPFWRLSQSALVGLQSDLDHPKLAGHIYVGSTFGKDGKQYATYMSVRGMNPFEAAVRFDRPIAMQVARNLNPLMKFVIEEATGRVLGTPFEFRAGDEMFSVNGDTYAVDPDTKTLTLTVPRSPFLTRVTHLFPQIQFFDDLLYPYVKDPRHIPFVDPRPKVDSRTGERIAQTPRAWAILKQFGVNLKEKEHDQWVRDEMVGRMMKMKAVRRIMMRADISEDERKFWTRVLHDLALGNYELER